jgi:site-specific DNA-methyltransferase (cytosine-N4-specific)
MYENQIFHKSCEKMEEIPDNSIRLIITSPPYFNAKDYKTKEQIVLKSDSYQEYIDSMVPVWKECFRVLKPNGKLCINTPVLPVSKEVLNTHYNRDYLNINNDIEFSILKSIEFYRFGLFIWDKGPTDQLMMGSYPYPPNFYQLNTIEFINVFVKDGEPEKINKIEKEKSKINKEDWYKYIQTIWKINTEKDRSHPAPFPIEIPRRLIELYSFVDDIILDPFMGSGTTALAALYSKRKYVGYELNEKYIRFANNRLKQQIMF